MLFFGSAPRAVGPVGLAAHKIAEIRVRFHFCGAAQKPSAMINFANCALLINQKSAWDIGFTIQWVAGNRQLQFVKQVAISVTKEGPVGIQLIPAALFRLYPA